MSGSAVYGALVCLFFVQSQDVRQAHQTMASYFEGCGQPVPEKFYAEDCRIYTPNHTDGDFQNLLDKLDFYIPAHFIGWMVKVSNLELLFPCVLTWVHVSQQVNATTE